LRGLRLFIRPIDPADRAIVTDFLHAQSADTPFPACGLLGKLLGEVVSVVVIGITQDALRIDDIVVAHHLRRKWIGRAMLREVEQLAIKMDKHRVVIDDARGAHEFFRRVGFENEGDRWIRRVG
jgi:GNAT superfamily N-acetyltransferase